MVVAAMIICGNVPVCAGQPTREQIGLNLATALWPFADKDFSVAFAAHFVVKIRGRDIHETDAQYEMQRFVGGGFHELIVDTTAHRDPSEHISPFEAILVSPTELIEVQDNPDGVTMILTRNPGPLKTMGQRLDGLGIFASLTHYHTADGLGLFEEFRKNDLSWTVTTDTKGRPVWEAQTRFGKARIVFAKAIANRVEKFEVVSGPKDVIFGSTVAENNCTEIRTVFDNFKVDQGRKDLDLPYSEYHFSETWTAETGVVRQADCLIEIQQARRLDMEAREDERYLKFRTTIPDGHPIEILGEPNIRFRWHNGTIEKDIDKSMENSLRTFASRFADKSTSFSDASPCGDEMTNTNSSGLCGVYSVFLIGQLLDTPIPFAELHETKYVSRPYGSSGEDILTALRDFGLSAEAFLNAGVSELRALTKPCILHFRARNAESHFQHWVVFLQAKGDGMEIFDPAYGIEQLRCSELLSRWDGVLIVAHNSPNRLTPLVRIARAARFEASAFMIAGLGTVFAFFAWGIRFVPGGTITHAIAALLIVGAVATAHGWLSPSGLFADPDCVNRILVNHVEFEAETVPLSAMVEIVGAKTLDVGIVDARFNSDFNRGHIPRAQNFPLDIGRNAEKDILNSLRSKKQVIVYCQSANCPFSVEIAKRLRSQGINELKVFAGGWREWTQNVDAENIEY